MPVLQFAWMEGALRVVEGKEGEGFNEPCLGVFKGKGRGLEGF